MYIGVDPGTYKSAIIEIRSDLSIVRFAYLRNEHLLRSFCGETSDEGFTVTGGDVIGVERFRSRLGIVGNDSLTANEWSGAFFHLANLKHEAIWIESGDIQALVGGPASRSDISAIVIDVYGGRKKAIGKIKCKECKGKGWNGRGRPTCKECRGSGWEHEPGPLAHVKGHILEALAVALAVRKIHMEDRSEKAKQNPAHRAIQE